MHLNETIVTKHAEDAAFSWLRRDLALRSNHYTHAERTRLDGRVDGHLDALRLAGQFGLQCCLESMETFGDPDEVFPAAVLALDDLDGKPIAAVVESARRDTRGLASAVGWHDFDHVAPLLDRWLQSDDVLLKRLGVAGFAIHRRDPGPHLLGGLHSVDPALRARSAKAAGELGRIDLKDDLASLLDDANRGVRCEAACSLARLTGRSASGPARLVDVLLTLTQEADPTGERAAATIVRIDPRAGLEHFGRWIASPESRRLAFVAADALGDPELVPQLIEWMDDPTVARIAGEAFRSISGADIAFHDLGRAAPPGHPGGPNDDPEDEHVAVEPDAVLPWPAASAVARFWAQHGKRFAPGHRYLDGRPMGELTPSSSPERVRTLLEVALASRPRHRSMAALELSFDAPGLPLLETRAFATRDHLFPGWTRWMEQYGALLDRAEGISP